MNLRSGRILRAVIAALSIATVMVLVYGGIQDRKAVVQQDTLVGVTEDPVQRILILGLDKYERHNSQFAYRNDMQCDFIMLVSVNAQKRACSAVQINRDTMLEINRLGVFGEEEDQFVGQLALAHSFGSGGSDSCINAVKAVSRLFGGIPIDHYMTFTMESVAILNDLVDGVTLEVLDDFSSEYSRLQKGEIVTLRGEEALTYVRGRRGVGDQTNISRMVRQKQYIAALYPKLQEKLRNNTDFLQLFAEKMSDRLETDFTASQMNALAGLMSEIEKVRILTLDGEVKRGAEYIEFYPSQSSLSLCAEALRFEQ